MARTIFDLGKNLDKLRATWKTTFDQKIETLSQNPRERNMREIPVAIAFNTAGDFTIFTNIEVMAGNFGHGRPYEYIIVLDENTAQLPELLMNDFLDACSSMAQNSLIAIQARGNMANTAIERVRSGRSARAERYTVSWTTYDEFANHRPDMERIRAIERKIYAQMTRATLSQFEEMTRATSSRTTSTFEQATRARYTGGQRLVREEPPAPRETIELKPGTKVHYLPKHLEGKPENVAENGIIKTIPKDNQGAVFVVYSCNNDWDNYKDYTAALTKIEDLKIGWV